MVVVNDEQIAIEVDEHGIATIPCKKDDVVVIDFIDGAGIAAPKAEGKSGKIYSVDGRQVTEMQPNTIYIVDGKKVMF
jgi:hypothetical protein